MKNYKLALALSLVSLSANAQSLLSARLVEHGTNKQYALTIVQTGPQTGLATLTGASGATAQFAVSYSKWSQDPLDGAVTIERGYFAGISQAGDSLSVYGNNTSLNTRGNCYYGYRASAQLNGVTLDEVPSDAIPMCPSEDIPFPGN